MAGRKVWVNTDRNELYVEESNFIDSFHLGRWVERLTRQPWTIFSSDALPKDVEFPYFELYGEKDPHRWLSEILRKVRG